MFLSFENCKQYALALIFVSLIKGIFLVTENTAKQKMTLPLVSSLWICIWLVMLSLITKISTEKLNHSATGWTVLYWDFIETMGVADFVILLLCTLPEDTICIVKSGVQNVLKTFCEWRWICLLYTSRCV